MFLENKKRCGHHGCSSSRRMYGVEDSNKSEFFSQHRRVGMVNLKSKRCTHHGCSRQPSYGVESNNKVEFRSVSTGGFTYLKNRRSHRGCSRQPSRGVEGINKRKRISKHRSDWKVGGQQHSVQRWSSRSSLARARHRFDRERPIAPPRTCCSRREAEMPVFRLRRRATDRQANLPGSHRHAKGTDIPVPTEGGMFSGSDSAPVKEEPGAFFRRTARKLEVNRHQ